MISYVRRITLFINHVRYIVAIVQIRHNIPGTGLRPAQSAPRGAWCSSGGDLIVTSTGSSRYWVHAGSGIVVGECSRSQTVEISQQQPAVFGEVIWIRQHLRDHRSHRRHVLQLAVDQVAGPDAHVLDVRRVECGVVLHRLFEGRQRSPDLGVPVLCRPRATAQLLAIVATRDFGGHRASRTRATRWSDRLHVVENPHDAHSPLRRLFDDEGLPTRPVVLVAGGAQVGHLHTTATAAAASGDPNGCAVRGPSHMPAPGFRGLDLTPTQERPPDLDEAIVVDDLIVAQEARRGGGAVVALGRLRTPRSVRPARVATRELLDDFTAHTRQVAADGRWSSGGVHGRTVLIDRTAR